MSEAWLLRGFMDVVDMSSAWRWAWLKDNKRDPLKLCSHKSLMAVQSKTSQ